MKSISGNKRKYALNLLFMAVLIGVTFYLIFKDQPIHDIWASIQNVNPFFLFAALFVMFIFICCEGMNIRVLTTSFGNRVPYRKCLKYAFVGFFFSAVTPSSTGGQPAQIYYMKKDHINISHSSLSLIVMLIMFQVVSMLYGIFMFVFKSAFILNSVRGIEMIVLYGVIANILLTTVLVGAIFAENIIERLLIGLVRLGAKIKIIRNPGAVEKSICRNIEEYHQSALYLKSNLSILFKVFFISFIQVTMQISVPYFVFLAFGQYGHSFLDFAAIQSWLTISVSSLPLPGAIGASEGCFIKMYSSLFSAGIIPAAMLVSRFASFYFYLVLSGIISMVAYMRMQRRKRQRR